MNEWMHLYSALLFIAVHPKRFTIMWGGGGGGVVSPQPPPVCSIHLDDATAATGQRRQRPAGTRRESHRANQVDGIIRRPWLTRASGGNFAWTGIHPYSLQEVPWDFLLTTESQDLGLTSHPKDGGGDRDFA